MTTLLPDACTYFMDASLHVFVQILTGSVTGTDTKASTVQHLPLKKLIDAIPAARVWPGLCSWSRPTRTWTPSWRRRPLTSE